MVHQSWFPYCPLNSCSKSTHSQLSIMWRILKSMALDWGHFYSLGDTWECLEIFLVVTVAGGPLASNREARQPTTMKNYALLNFNCAGVEKPCFKGGHPWASVPAHCLPAAWPCSRQLSSVNLSFHIYKIGLMTVVGVKWKYIGSLGHVLWALALFSLPVFPSWSPSMLWRGVWKLF